jgi:hypothetical protein
MKSAGIYSNNKSKSEVDKVKNDIDEKPEFPKQDDGSFEKLFYSAIDVFASIKFNRITQNLSKIFTINCANLVESSNDDFIKNKENLSRLFEKETYKNLVKIINESCAEKFVKFISIKEFEKKEEEFDKKISEFFKANNQNIKLINDKIGKDPSRKCLEIILKNLQEQDPEKFENLIEFEINKIELKMANENIKFVTGDSAIKPPPLFLKDIKECSKLQERDSKKTRSVFSCAIS